MPCFRLSCFCANDEAATGDDYQARRMRRVTTLTCCFGERGVYSVWCSLGSVCAMADDLSDTWQLLCQAMECMEAIAPSASHSLAPYPSVPADN